MKAIYAAKLYRASNRKEQIKSALEDPRNEKLVKQLARYLDDEYAQTAASPEAESGLDTASIDSAGGQNSTSRGAGPSPSHGGGSYSGPGDIADIELPGGEDGEGEVLDDETGEGSETDSTLGIDEGELGEEVDEVDEGVVEVENSQSRLGRNRVTASTNIDELPNELRGTLNSREECAGVDRVIFKGNELWIHYNDDTNLNNVMTNVIELFNAAGYTYLEFNRLARSANAMVFVSSIVDTNNEVKPVEDVDDKE